MLNAMVSDGLSVLQPLGGLPRHRDRGCDGPTWPSPWRPCRDMLEFETVLRRRTRGNSRRTEWGLGLLRASVTIIPVGAEPMSPGPMSPGDADHANLVLDVRVGGEIDGSWAAIRSAPGEYLVLCHHLRGVADARGVVSRLAHRLAWPLEVRTQLIAPRVTVGIALDTPSGSGADELRARCDRAVTRARRRIGLRIAVDAGRRPPPGSDR